jgi:hypothetical protein
MSNGRLQRWEKIRAKGKKKFLMLVTLVYGLFSALGLFCFKYYFHPEKVDWIFIIGLIPFGLTNGFFMAKFFWWQNERKYSQLMKNQ